MRKFKQSIFIKLIDGLLLWMTSIFLVVVVYLAVWWLVLHGHYWLGDWGLQRQQIVAYLLGEGRDGLPDIGFLNFAEARHLLDVRRLFSFIETLLYYFLPVSMLIFFLKRSFSRGIVLLYTGYLGLGSVLLLGLSILSGGFVALFVFLHTLLFPVGTWVFPVDSSLIQLFPLDYFFRFALWYVGSLTLLFTGLIIILKGSMGFGKR